MSAITIKDGTDVSDGATESHALFVIPRERGDGFQAAIRGHIVDLADPSSGHALAPTPNDLLIVSIASDLAWSTRRFLRARRLPDQVSVSARWRTDEDAPGLADIGLTVTVSKAAETVRDALAAVFTDSLAARSHAEPVVHISLKD
jgi:uncharacterized OsmC-like protein